MSRVILVTAPVATVSGYGVMARDITRNIIKSYPDDVVKIISLPWGNCPTNALEAGKDDDLISRTMTPPFSMDNKPNVHVHVGIPTEFFPQGDFNILATAGIETSAASVAWLEACNRADLILVTSEHSKNVFLNSVGQKLTQQGQVIGRVTVAKPVEVLPISVDTNVFNVIGPSKIPESITSVMDKVTEQFCYLFVGHWLPGNYGEDRKNVSVLVKVFAETFKQLPKSQQPALVLKTSGGNFSVMDRYEITNKVEQLKNSVGDTCPNIYVLHGDVSPEEMNGLYNHPKVKVHVSFTHGEGQGMPLLEATLSNKPVMAPKWSGQLDFLTEKNSILLTGKLEKIPQGSVWPDVLIPESEWFNVDTVEASRMLFYTFKNYAGFKSRTEWLAQRNREKFSTTTIQATTKSLLDRYLPKPVIQSKLKLPALNKL